jgi:glycosyltransferase involved in cell wall biosynthesis
MYQVSDEGDVARIVNNAPYAGLRRAEQDGTIRRWIETEEAAFRPDVVHLQHPAYLTADLRVRAPLVWTLHDAWAWCAAGGQLLREGRACDGPGPACPACASAWAKDGPAVAMALEAASLVGRVVPGDRLHAAWALLPAGLRAAATRRAAAITPRQIDARRSTLLALARRATLLSPSRWLADEAVRHGLPRPRLLPHGVPTLDVPRSGTGPLVFCGTLSPHKGPDLVREAHRRSGLARPLEVWGPPGADAAFAAAQEGRGPCRDVPALLARARALVLGSRWPENAPLVVLEARAAGCPVVAPRIGGLPELVEDGVDGLLFQPGDVDDLARCLRRAEHARFAVRPPPTLEEHVAAVEDVYKEVR